MKVAVCFAGLPRFTRARLTNWQTNLIKKYDAEVFVHTWNTGPGILSDLSQHIQPTGLIIEPLQTFDTRQFKERVWPHRSNPNSVLSMWSSINKSFGLAFEWAEQQNITWDIMIRARWDWEFDQIDLIRDNAIHVPFDPGLSGHLFSLENQVVCAHNDQFAWGPADQMRIYSSLYDHISWLYESGVDFCSEVLLTAHLINHRIDITYENIQFRFGNG